MVYMADSLHTREGLIAKFILHVHIFELLAIKGGKPSPPVKMFLYYDQKKVNPYDQKEESDDVLIW